MTSPFSANSTSSSNSAKSGTNNVQSPNRSSAINAESVHADIGTRADSTKKRLLECLKRKGPLTAQQLAEMLDVSTPAARRHLSDLQEQQLVQVQTEKPSGRGRPQHIFELTEGGEAHFPKTYSRLCLEICRHLEHLYGTGALVQVLSARTNDLAQHIKQKIPPHLPLDRRLGHLVEELNEMGFDAILEHDGEYWYVVQRNCPNLTIARQYQELCAAELQFYVQVLGLEVTRQSRIACGQGVCRYRINGPYE